MASEYEVTAIELEGGERAVSLSRRLGVENAGLNIFTFQHGDGSRIHRHRNQEEVFLVLRGALTVRFETGDVVLGENDVVRVAPMTKRQLVNDGDEPCVVVALGATGAHVRGDAEAFLSWDDPQPRSPSEVPLPGAG